MQTLLREVARGAKGARDLSYAEAYQAAVQILEGRATDAQTGAFLVAERVKGESVPELLAFLHALAAHNPPPLCPAEGLLDCAGPYDGRSKSFAATVPVSLVLAAAGVPVLLHAPDALPPKSGVSLKSVVRELGLPLGVRPGAGARWAFVDPEEVHPGLRALRRIRQELGVRTLFNTVEKFLNLGGASLLVTGVFHGTAVRKVTELAASLSFQQVMVVQGLDGSEDLPVHRPSLVHVVSGGDVTVHQVDPALLGVQAPGGPVRFTAAEHAAHALAILRGEQDAFRPLVLLNSGVRLWLAGRVASIREGVDWARDLLDSRQAWAVYQQHIHAG
ncbi:MAG: anthranilate phosphoribosyltransferase [Alicyclobacillus sp.]|nr:anthranilate phosphoribosyltransferase [Alicyclobacillus sp.]